MLTRNLDITLFSVLNSNLMVTTDSRNVWADTSILFNHTNITPTFPLLVSMFTRSDSNLKNTNLRELVICLVSITLLSNLHSLLRLYLLDLVALMPKSVYTPQIAMYSES